MNVRIATPPEFELHPAIVERSRSIAVNQTQVMVTHDPEAAAKGLCTLHRRLGQYGARGTSFFPNSMFQPYQMYCGIADPRRLFCTAYRLAKKLPMRSWKPHNRGFGIRQKTGCMPKRLCLQVVGRILEMLKGQFCSTECSIDICVLPG